METHVFHDPSNEDKMTTKPMTRKQMENAEHRIAEATDAPWICTEGLDPDIKDRADWYIVHQVCSGVDNAEDSGARNGRFIQHAREDLPAAVALIELWEPLFRHTLEGCSWDVDFGPWERPCPSCAEARKALETFDD